MNTLDSGTARLVHRRVAFEWKLERMIGRGGMGVVHAARHVTTGETVAIKVLGAVHLRDSRAGARFAREIRVAMKLKSPHAARVRSVGHLPTGEPMMVMELLEGEDLRVIAQRHRSIPVEDALSWIEQACDAVGEAHDFGFIHRDLKLANIFLCRARTVKVLDFGLAKATERQSSEASLTEAGSFLGTPHFMAPEMFECSRDVDARVDVWALGVCLYRLVTGVLPFQGVSMVALCGQVLQGEITPPTRHRPDLPRDVEHVILRCLARDPARRYADARALGRALATCRAIRREAQSLTRVHASIPSKPVIVRDPEPLEAPTLVEPRRSPPQSPAATLAPSASRTAPTVAVRKYKAKEKKAPWACLIAVAAGAALAGLGVVAAVAHSL
jgi:eukaryotic-like serine/threonine-protein kinase